jgi:hypothetical protein
VGRRWLIAVLLLASTGAIATGADKEGRSWTFNLDWLIGGVGMAVDGDDRDDHIGWFDDDGECECRHE